MAVYKPADFIDDIGNKKLMLVDDPVALHEFNAFFICRLLSFHIDSIFIVERANRMTKLSDYDLYNYLTLRIRKMKRKWAYAKQPEPTAEVLAICEHYGISVAKAHDAEKLLSPEFVKSLIVKQGDIGGGGSVSKRKTKAS